ncbi:MAG: Ppx/GppA family phosphatase [Myxococcales bacterium]|nr:Ppx/GppA family phosphatase [Myxococcales bacterium]
MRVGAIDIGTNSVLLLIAERGSVGGGLTQVIDRATITRIGQGVDRTGMLADEAVARTLACIDDYAATLREHEVELVAAVATSAMRDAKGGERFLDGFEQRVGVRPEVISGDREAALTFRGALCGLEDRLTEARVAVFDVGGGSTEIIVGERGRGEAGIEAAISIDVGAVRMTERHVHGDPTTSEEVAAIREDVRRLLAPAPDLHGLPLVGVAGTVTTVAAVVGGVDPYDGSRVHGSRLSASDMAAVIDRLAACTLAERREIVGLDPKRADVILAGALVTDEVRARAGADSLMVSDRGVRWGLALELTD